MNTLVVNKNNFQTKQVFDYDQTPSTMPIIEKRSSSKKFQQAVEACRGVTVDAFFDELDNRLKKHYQNE